MFDGPVAKQEGVCRAKRTPVLSPWGTQIDADCRVQKPTRGSPPELEIEAAFSVCE